MREPDRRDGSVTQPPDQREIGRHHRDLAELGQRHRPGELDRVGDLGSPDKAIALRRGGGRPDGSEVGHGAAP